MFVLFALMLSLPTVHAAQNSTVGAVQIDSPEHHRSCARDLLGSEAAHPLSLATAVLIRDKKDQLHFAYGSYFFSQHSSLLWQAVEHLDIKDILWMGEIRYELVGERPLIHEANETSGYYKDNVCTGWACGVGQTIPMANDYRNLPLQLRADDFHGDHYNEQRQHLPAELNVSNRNLRHAIGQSLNAICTIMSYAQIGLYKNAEDLHLDVENNKSDIELAEQVLSYSLLKGMITRNEVRAILHAIDMLKEPQLSVGEILESDVNLVLWQVQSLSETSMRLFSLRVAQPSP